MNMSSNLLVVVVDYGLGNIRSVVKKIQSLDYNVISSNEIKVIKKADKLVFPGVGQFQTAMRKLREARLIDILNKKSLIEKIPILGICLGMQLFSRFSEEGDTEGLNWLDAETIKFTITDINYKVPHIGWNTIDVKKNSTLLNNVPRNNEFYFLHSYHLKFNDNNDILATTNYGYDFVSAIQKENIFGTQFHPEKSHNPGETLLRNFLSL